MLEQAIRISLKVPPAMVISIYLQIIKVANKYPDSIIVIYK